MLYKKIITYVAILNLLFLPMNAMANSKAEKKEEKAVTESTILLIASAYSGIALVAECQLFSTAIFAAGALYYVYAEIKNWDNFKKASDHIVGRYQMLNKEKTEAQVDVLSKAEEQTREAEQAARERAGNAKSAGTIFLIAAIMSIVEFVLHNIYGSPEDTCQSTAGYNHKKNKPTNPLMNLIMPAAFAQADANQARLMGITSPESVAKLSSALWGMTEVMDTVKSNAIVRAVVFGGFSLIAFQVAKMTEEAADIYKKQADIYKKELNRLLNSLSKIGYIQYNEKRLGLAALREIDNKKLATLKANCAARSGFSFFMDNDCNCRSKSSCKRVNLPQNTYSNFSPPGALTESLSTFTTMANQNYSDDTASGDLAQSNLNNNANALRKYKRTLEDATNQSRAKNEMTPINFKEQESLMAKKIKSIIKKGITPEAKALLSTGLGISLGSASGSKEESKKEAKTIKKIFQSYKPKTKSRGKKPKDSLANFLLLGESQNQEKLDTATELAKYKDNDEEITKDKRKSIFKIITNRYIKSAFPILFDEEK